jgi:MFS family permease
MSKKSISRFRRRDYVKITVFGFAITALWQSLHSIVLPLRLLDFVPEAQKNTYLGWLTFCGLILALAVQPIAGAISDRSGFKWGLRRPYILMGGIVALLILPGIGLAGSFTAIFAVYCLLQIASNTAQGPYQAFLPFLRVGAFPKDGIKCQHWYPPSLAFISAARSQIRRAARNASGVAPGHRSTMSLANLSSMLSELPP